MVNPCDPRSSYLMNLRLRLNLILKLSLKLMVLQGALFNTLLSEAAPCIAAHLRKSRDTP